MTEPAKQQAQDESEVDWKTFKIILCGAPALFLLVAVLADAWSTVFALLVFAPIVVVLIVLRRGLRRSVTLHMAMALLVAYQVVLLQTTTDEPNIGLVWFVAIPVIVGLLGNRWHVLVWTPVALASIGYCWRLYSVYPALAHPLALPNLLGATLVIGAAAFGMIVQRDRRERALKKALLAARRETRERQLAETEITESRAAITRFLGSVSHELRTPLTSIVLATDALDRGTENPDQKTWLNNIRSSADSLVLLLNDVLDLAQSDAGRTALREEVFALEDMLGEVRAVMAPMITERDIDIEWFIGAMPDVREHYQGDAARLRQVLVNLISNALHHSGGNRVWLAVSVRGEALFLAVGDNGRGIAADAQRKIFQPFRQLSSDAQDGEHRGSGLGLTISAGYVEAMGGRLGVRSTPGKGAVFEVSLPAARASGRPLADVLVPSSAWPLSIDVVGDFAPQVAWVRAWLAVWQIEHAVDGAPLRLVADQLPLTSLQDVQRHLDVTGSRHDATGTARLG